MSPAATLPAPHPLDWHVPSPWAAVTRNLSWVSLCISPLNVVGGSTAVSLPSGPGLPSGPRNCVFKPAEASQGGYPKIPSCSHGSCFPQPLSCRKCGPRLSAEAAEKLKNRYIIMRSGARQHERDSDRRSSIPITVR